MRLFLQAKTRLRYIASYLWVSVLPILACAGILMYFNFQTTCDRLTENGHNALALARSNVDLLIKNMESCGNHFSSNRALIDAYEESGYNLISPQLASYQTSYPFLARIAFYLKGEQNIFDTDGLKFYKQFQHDMARGIDLDMTMFFQHLLTEQRFTLVDTLLGVGQQGQYLLYFHAVPLLDATPIGTLAFFVDRQIIQSTLELSMGDAPYDYWILNDSMEPVYARTLSARGDALFAQAARIKGTGTFRLAVGKERTVLFRLFSENTSLHYWAAIPQSVLLADAYAALRQQVFWVGMLTVLVASLAVLVGTIRFTPIKRLADDVLETPEEALLADQDIFAHLRQQYQRIALLNSDLVSRIQDQQSLLRRQHAALRHQMLEQLAQGVFRSEADVRARLQEADLSFPHDGFLAVVAYLDAYDEENSPLDILDAHYFKDGLGYPLILDQEQNIALLVNLPLLAQESAQASRSRRLLIGQRFQDLIAQHGLSARKIGVGGIHLRLTDMAVSLLEAQTALQSAQESTPLQVYAPSEQVDLFQAFLPVADKALLCLCIAGGHADIAQTTFQKMLADIRQAGPNPLLERSWRIFLCDAVVSVIIKQNLTIDTRALSRAAGFSGLEDFSLQMRQVIQAACDMLMERAQHRTQHVYQTILRTLQENFSDYDLSLRSISAQFNLSENTVSRFIKKETGYTFAQYLNQLRMAYVERQLTHTNRAIKDIVHQAGYMDVANFIRKFRQAMGMTPGEYRQAYQDAQAGSGMAGAPPVD